MIHVYKLAKLLAYLFVTIILNKTVKFCSK